MPSAGQLTTVLVIFFSMAGFVWLMRRHFARRYGVPPSRVRWISGGLALFGIVFAIVSSLVLRAAANPVICRARLEGTAGMRQGDPAVVRTARFEVVHSGREHYLSVQAVPVKGIEVRGPVRMRLSLTDPRGTALADTDLVLPVRPSRFWPWSRASWEPGGVTFHPPVTGRCAVRLVPLHPGLRRLDVKVVERRRVN
jgi:hypothetical protein